MQRESSTCVLSCSVMLDSCHPVNCSPPGSSVHGIVQARILEWLPCPPPGESSQLRDWTYYSKIIKADQENLTSLQWCKTIHCNLILKIWDGYSYAFKSEFNSTDISDRVRVTWIGFKSLLILSTKPQTTGETDKSKTKNKAQRKKPIRPHREWVKSLSRVWLFATPWTVAHQAPPSMGFSRQEYWSGLPCPSPGDLPNPGIEPGSPTLRGRRFNLWATREAPSDLILLVYFEISVNS